MKYHGIFCKADVPASVFRRWARLFLLSFLFYFSIVDFMTAKIVLNVGQCRPDTAAITHFLTSNLGAQVINADLPGDSMTALRAQPVDLVLINRKLDADYSDGMDILAAIKADLALAHIPVMLVSNFPEWQEKAIDAGATYGFGKAELNSTDTIDRVRGALGLS